ncbi:hypothetical protein DXG01_004976 [Tephrocybe rancida]|nr:hypothetical protein DXG01_004976 [Tephrocybe rancida]
MNQTIRVFVLQAKLDDSEIAELYSLIESQRGVVGLHLQLCGNISDADIILSNRQKAIVTPDWLRDSIAQQRPLPCAEYAALGQLKDETAKNCPECDLSVCQCSLTESKGSSLWSTGVANQVNTSLEVMSNYAARYACLRASPLVCPNQSLAAELGVLRMHRDLEGKSVNALSYERAIAELSENVVRRGSVRATHSLLIDTLETIRASERFQSLKKFTTIHNVGATTARHLYNIGLRTIEDIERYYEVPAADDGGPTLITDGAAINPLSGKRIPTSEGLGAPDFDIKAALTLRHELADSVPRAEVEEIRDFVISELEELQPGCVSTIVGGYRRGKPQSNDVDIVITHPNLRSGSDQVKSFRKRAVQRLYERGAVSMYE